MVVRIYNTLTRRGEEFQPLNPDVVGMYTCGPTVYDYAHIGNFRAYIFYDLLKRWLRYRGFRVRHIMNLTDVDDKTIRGSREKGIPLREYTDRYVKIFFEDLEALNIKPADLYPRATEHIPEMVALIRKLKEGEYAYEMDGSFYYDISKFKPYGALSKVKMEGLRAGVRGEADEYAKDEVRDFALWKGWDEGDGDVFWVTELGKGRPGWHIECSAMAMKYLGGSIDIHAGGVDLIFPHHENEIAQTEASTGAPFAKYWVHCEHLMVEGQKMAKSLGNFYTLRDVMSRGFDPKAIRFLLLSTHYREQLNFTFEGLKAAGRAIERLIEFVDRVGRVRGGEGGGNPEVEGLIANVRKSFGEALDDDLDVNRALSTLFEFVRSVNKMIDETQLGEKTAQGVLSLMRELDGVLGIMGGRGGEEELPPHLRRLVELREEARLRLDWGAADKIRAELLAEGVRVEDTREGPRWRRERKGGC